MNQVILSGNVGNTPELKNSANGNKYTRVSLATNAPAGMVDGKPTFKTQWHNLFFFGDKAEEAMETCTRGAKVSVVGSLDYYEVDINGVNVTKTNIKATSVEPVDKPDPTQA